MFSDKFRLLKITIPIFIILITVFYGEIKGPQLFPGFLEARENPQQFINKEISFGGKINEINKNYFLIEIEKKPIKVLGEVEKNKLNYSINGKAIYLADGSLKLLKFHLSNIRIYKIILSIFPILLIGYLFLKEYKFDFKSKMFIKKLNNA